MSSPTLWILIPGAIGGITFIVRRFAKTTNLLGFFVVIILAVLARLLPIGETFTISFLPFLPPLVIEDTLFILGRSFVLGQESQTTLVLIYTSAAFWFGGALIAHPPDSFIPVGLGLAALFTAAISVEPFLYAALIIVIATLISVLILMPPGSQSSRGVFRFITFQTLGMPFMLVAGWYLTGVETEITDPAIILRVSALLGLGYAFFMAIFPFHSWVPMLANKLHPYSVAFVIYFFPQVGSLLVLSFLSRYSWFSVVPDVFSAIRIMGGLMVFFGGVWAAFQNHLGRMMGFAALMEIGFTLLAISGLEPGYYSGSSFSAQEINFSGPLLGIYYAQFIPRLISLAVWALALVSLLDNMGTLNLHQIAGAGTKLPIASISVVVAIFSLAGLPLLAGFPIRLALWETIVTRSLPVAFIVLAGILGLFFAGFRTLSYLLRSSDRSWTIGENKAQAILLVTGWLVLLVIGLFPNLLFEQIMDITRVISPFSP
jgi:formate hydrogenlyase subunit 3/multisubunit Na+/H+ antiporter MnhD subunit